VFFDRTDLHTPPVAQNCTPPGVCIGSQVRYFRNGDCASEFAFDTQYMSITMCVDPKIWCCDDTRDRWGKDSWRGAF